jgi:nucleotide-binding universal stress UspA family protein
MFQPRIILCPIDFTENAVIALGVATDIARQNQSTLLVLHVADTLGPEGATFREVETRLEPESHIADLQRMLQQAAPPQHGLTIRHLLTEGNPAKVVQQIVAEQHVDLVVLGTHGRTGLDRFLMGSIAEEILRRCPCPVLIVKYPRANPSV